MPLMKKTTENQTTNADAKETIKATTAAEAPVQADSNKVYGELSDKIEFVACLGDPSRDDVTQADPKTGAPKRVDPTIVGYRFKTNVDIEVPDIQPGEDYKGLKNPMSFTGDVLAKRTVKAGETFDLTRFETGVFVSQESINARITGGDIKVAASYMITQKKNSAGTIATAQTKVPTVSLRGLDGKSVKDVPFINVLTFEKIETGTRKDKDGKDIATYKKVRKIVPGFEKWSKLCEEAVKVTGSGSGSRSSENANERSKGAEIFMNFINKKAKSAQ